MFLYGEDIDKKITWPLGRAERLARRGKLPHIVLPDGSIRFRWDQIEPLIRVVGTDQVRSDRGATACDR